MTSAQDMQEARQTLRSVETIPTKLLLEVLESVARTAAAPDPDAEDALLAATAASGASAALKSIALRLAARIRRDEGTQPVTAPQVGEIAMTSLAGSSSNLEAMGYDAEQQVLRVSFLSGATFDYATVPPEVFEELQSAKSRGSFFARRIRKSYPASRVVTADEAKIDTVSRS